MVAIQSLRETSSGMMDHERVSVIPCVCMAVLQLGSCGVFGSQAIVNFPAATGTSPSESLPSPSSAVVSVASSPGMVV